MKQTALQAIDRESERFKSIARFIGSHPELGHEEFQACERLTGELEASGFTVEREVLGIPTAFVAKYRSAKPGPVIAFLAEYDALPDLGHACGHHLICSMSVAAAVGVKSILDRTGGEIRVYGTPAEETKGAKIPMSEAGLFDDVDAALMAHPYYRFERSGKSLAMDAIQFEFFGKAAHAAANPSAGINALDAVIQLFNSINALRQQLEDHVRIHGIIVNGGQAANIIPDYACAQFYVRSATRPHTNMVVEKVMNCAKGAALQTGCTWKASNYEYSYDELITNERLSRAFTDNLVQLGIRPEEIHTADDHGSVDLGNVSRRCPAIHPYVKVIDEMHLLHTKEFRDLAMTERAFDSMILGAKALAATACDLLLDAELLKAVKEEFKQATA